MSIPVDHRSDCGSSRTVPGVTRNTGIEPKVIAYLDFSRPQRGPSVKEGAHRVIDARGTGIARPTP